MLLPPISPTVPTNDTFPIPKKPKQQEMQAGHKTVFSHQPIGPLSIPNKTLSDSLPKTSQIRKIQHSTHRRQNTRQIDLLKNTPTLLLCDFLIIVVVMTHQSILSLPLEVLEQLERSLREICGYCQSLEPYEVLRYRSEIQLLPTSTHLGKRQETGIFWIQISLMFPRTKQIRRHPHLTRQWQNTLVIIL